MRASSDEAVVPAHSANRRPLSGQHADVEDAVTELVTDGEVMARARVQPRWFAVVFDRHFVTIHRYLSRRVGSESADDLAGEVFRVAFERRGSFDPERDSARPWLYGIATNLVHRERRSEERRLRAVQRLAARPSVPAAEDTFEVVDERVEAEGAVRSVAPALAQLPHADRDALVMVVVEGLTYSETAAALGIPIGTVRSRISRGRLRLRELLDVSGQQGVVWSEAEEPGDG